MSRLTHQALSLRDLSVAASAGKSQPRARTVRRMHVRDLRVAFSDYFATAQAKLSATYGSPVPL
jgi:hypothetical protein